MLIIVYFYHWKSIMCGTWWFWCLLKQKQETREVVCFLVVHPLVKLVLFGCPWLERCICGMFEIASQSLSWFCKLYRSCFCDISPTTRNARSRLGMVIERLKNKKNYIFTRDLSRWTWQYFVPYKIDVYGCSPLNEHLAVPNFSPVGWDLDDAWKTAPTKWETTQWLVVRICHKLNIGTPICIFSVATVCQIFPHRSHRNLEQRQFLPNPSVSVGMGVARLA